VLVNVRVVNSIHFNSINLFLKWPTTGRARVPSVNSLKGGTTRRLVPAERRGCRPGRSATWATGPRYSGAIPCITLNVTTAILKTTRSGTRSRCKLTSASVTWLKRQVYKSTSKTAPLTISCSHSPLLLTADSKKTLTVILAGYLLANIILPFLYIPYWKLLVM